ncbi:MAG: 2-oxoglutarate ferredoxin oxidoreductase subunit gamma [Syntrophus sp. SKADARSKE-3]|nr:2-oxoglutarate ferredoxin oxidoreductase subunit gamma [Syntrophus sp. SKADARSKE-3]
MLLDKEKHVLITGFGGQGIVMAGDILGKAATLFDDRHATMTQNYGPEARGGSCTSQVIISTEEILFPMVENPEVLICMSQEGYTKNVSNLRPEGTLIWDADLVRVENPDPGWQTYQIPATRFSEELGNKMMANIVMLGFLAAVKGLVTAAALRNAVMDSVPSATKENNGKAFDRGFEYGEAILKGRAKKEHAKVSK